MIVSSKEILLAHTSVDKTLTFELIRPYLLDAEERFLAPILGEQFITAMIAWTDTEGLKFRLKDLAERAAANIGLCLYLPAGNIQISDSGAQISSTKEKKMAFEWQINRSIDSISRLAMNALEQLIEVLESNIDNESLSLYKNSAIRSVNNSFFIRTASEFNNSYHIDRNRLTFICLQTIMRQVERDFIIPVLTKEVADDLKTKRNSNSLSAIEKINFDTICSAIAFLTIKNALPQLAVEISPLGLSANYFSMINNVGYKNPVSDTRVQMLMSHVEEKSNFYLQQLPALLPDYDATQPRYISGSGLKIFPGF
jgi:hypothetical protein